MNYGAIPQTWEDPAHVDTELNLKGDNDPLDVIEIGQRPCASGDVYAVKVVGALAMIDGGELDWKIVTVAVSDPLAENLDGASLLAQLPSLSLACDFCRHCAPRV